MTYKCKYCGKEFDKANSIGGHTSMCVKNPNCRKSNFSEYNNKVKNGEIEKKFTNQYTKAKYEGKEIIISDATRKKMSNSSVEKWKREDYRSKTTTAIKKAMKQVVRDNPDSYSASNVSGRVKTIEYNGFKLKGSWELEVAKSLDEHNIKWTNIISGIEYEWDGDVHLYFPDFYLPEYDLYIEVKGYERERDRAKWKAVDNLVVIKQKQINEIKRKEFNWGL